MQHILRDLRKRAGLSQKALAERAGVDRTTVIRHEAGECRLDERTIEAYCRELGCTPNDLLGYTKAS